MLTGNVFSEPMSGLIKKCYNKVVEYLNLCLQVHVAFACTVFLQLNITFIFTVVIEFSWQQCFLGFFVECDVFISIEFYLVH